MDTPKHKHTAIIFVKTRKHSMGRRIHGNRKQQSRGGMGRVDWLFLCVEPILARLGPADMFVVGPLPLVFCKYPTLVWFYFYYITPEVQWCVVAVVNRSVLCAMWPMGLLRWKAGWQFLE
jgi:hypothetical protein